MPISCPRIAVNDVRVISYDPRSQIFSLFGRSDKQQAVHSGCNQAKVSEHAYPFVYKQNGGSRSTSSPGPSPLRFSKWRRRQAAILKIAEEKALGTRLGSRWLVVQNSHRCCGNQVYFGSKCCSSHREL